MKEEELLGMELSSARTGKKEDGNQIGSMWNFVKS